MCGILGYYSDKPIHEHFDMIQGIFYQSKIRGLHAFGICYMYEGSEEIHTLKDLEVTPILERIEELSSDPPNRMIGHSRYTTCEGGWENMENNQPTVAYGMAHGFNGVISMKTKEEYEEEFGEKYLTEQDGEIFMKYLSKGGDPQEFFSGLPYSYAGTWLKDGHVFTFRNDSRPLWALSMENNTRFIVSTYDILRRSIGECDAYPLVPHKVFKLPSLETLDVKLAYGRELGSVREVYRAKI